MVKAYFWAKNGAESMTGPNRDAAIALSERFGAELPEDVRLATAERSGQWMARGSDREATLTSADER